MSTIEPKKRRHWGRWIIVIILCLLVGRFFYAVFYKDIYCGGEQAKMVKYLENKYGKKYVTKNCHINMAGMWMKKFCYWTTIFKLSFGQLILNYLRL